jgi:hypothetical protein
MKKRWFVLTGILVFIAIILVAGCEMIEEQFATGSIQPVPAECNKEANFLDNALYRSQERGDVSKMQVTRVTNLFNTCLQNAGLSKADAKATLKDRIKTFNNRPDKGKAKGAEDFFVF